MTISKYLQKKRSRTGYRIKYNPVAERANRIQQFFLI